MSLNLEELLGSDAQDLLSYQCKGVTADELTLPGPDYIDRVLLASVYAHGRLGGTGYLSILPVDQGIEHSAAASFAKNPAYFDPANLVELAIEGGASAIATTLGGLGILSRRFVHRIPFIVKINHNMFLHYPNTYDQILF